MVKKEDIVALSDEVSPSFGVLDGENPHPKGVKSPISRGSFGRVERGKKEHMKFKRGESLTRHEAILAQCYECCGYYADGKGDCKSTLCPLYQYMPYRA
jgi:hypothetical protein